MFGNFICAILKNFEIDRFLKKAGVPFVEAAEAAEGQRPGARLGVELGGVNKVQNIFDHV